MKTLIAKFFIVSALLTLLTGCKEEALTATVRTGDTVIVSLSADDLRESGDTSGSAILRAEQLSASLTDAANTEHSVQVRQVFRVYADPTSEVQQLDNAGLWLAAIDLVDPLSASAPTLASGSAELTLSAPGYFDTDKVVTLEVVAGLGTPKTFGDLSLGAESIEPAPQALATVTGSLEGHLLAAVQHQFTIPHSDTLDIDSGTALKAALVKKLPGQEMVNLNVTTTATESGATEVQVYLTAVEGLSEVQLSEFNIALISQIDAANAQADYWSQHYSGSQYFDTEGNTLSLSTQVSAIR
ncbi:hypothetical protein P3339_13810 [Microbulbifer sp. MLAF003]|uniref:hypothetical protein n=1 Tax=Microbulbifer sp. MLAF003 TaxID=3032582 RepID=UPI0024AD37BF|nr:hypothetical protein [Microbulbifer sp. MLAF003]WHI49545.1 hypothetical protein P3339_13810 [Microbulbifer sp. MLAF003]